MSPKRFSTAAWIGEKERRCEEISARIDILFPALEI